LYAACRDREQYECWSPCGDDFVRQSFWSKSKIATDTDDATWDADLSQAATGMRLPCAMAH
jgi:hypothetical protein